MRAIILTTIAAMLTGGVASAQTRDHRGSVRVDHRATVNRGFQGNRGFNRGFQGGRFEARRSFSPSFNRRPVFATHGRFNFGGGYYRPYVRPVIRQRYFNYWQRPAFIYENYEPIPGYLWVPGNWQWNGVEWVWIDGHYAVDANYVGPYYGY